MWLNHFLQKISLRGDFFCLDFFCISSISQSIIYLSHTTNEGISSYFVYKKHNTPKPIIWLGYWRLSIICFEPSTSIYVLLYNISLIMVSSKYGRDAVPRCWYNKHIYNLILNLKNMGSTRCYQWDCYIWSANISEYARESRRIWRGCKMT